MEVVTGWDGKCINCQSEDVDFTYNNVIRCKACWYRFAIDPHELDEHS